MGVPLNLKDIQSGFLTASAFNANNALTEQAMNKALDRTGSSDNAMEVDLDMGLNFINNLKEAYLDHQAVNFSQAQNLVAASSSDITSTAEREVLTATAAQTDFTFSNIEYISGVNALIVFVNGVYQISGTDYLENSSTSIQFTSGLNDGDVVVVIGARFDAEVFLTESSTFADAAAASAATASDFSDEAMHWANYPEDSLVPEGDLVDDYSAFHWAQKAEDEKLAAEIAAGYKLGINNQTGTSYTLAISDAGKLIRMDNTSSNIVTVPDNATVAFEVGTLVTVRQIGTGTTTISPAAGVTINSPLGEFDTDGEEFGIGLVKVATDEWDLVKSYAGIRANQFDYSIDGSSNFIEGYQKLPSGLVMQWGPIDASSGSVVFPYEYTAAVLSIQITANRSTGIATAGQYSSPSTTGFSYNADVTGGTASWFALGV